MLRFVALAVALVVAPGPALASEPPRNLTPEVCEADQRPATTSLAVPEPVRLSARRAEQAERAQRRRASRRSPITRMLLVAAAAAAVGALLIAESR
jgi:hypothetical protein